MAPPRQKRKAAVPTRLLTQEQFCAWLRERIGPVKHEAFAAEIGVSRQALSMVLIGKRPAGVRFLAKLRGAGVVGVQRMYQVEDPPPPVVK